MTIDVFNILYTTFNSVWLFFSSWHIPGTNISPAEFFVFIIVAYFVLRLVRYVTHKKED